MKKNALFLLLTAALLAGCNNDDKTVAAAPATDPRRWRRHRSCCRNSNWLTVTTQPVAETLRVAGRIDFDEQRLARIGATITGRVTEVDALLGQEVKKGEVLARLNSSELSTQQLAYLRARSQLELNRRNAERAKSLFEADVIGAAELQRRAE
jgi:cobalt-zinc-cadmium efflux system membrane fusion protein